MSISRWIVVVPVLAGLAVTGTAMARMLPAETVRDTVYQTCQHNGVHFNKQGHANCGLHKGWSNDPTTEPGTEPGGDTGGEPVDAPTTDSGSGGHHGHGPKHTAGARHGKSGHGSGKGHGGGKTTHGPSTHGHGNGHGKGSSTHSHGGGNGHAGGNGHSKKS